MFLTYKNNLFHLHGILLRIQNCITHIFQGDAQFLFLYDSFLIFVKFYNSLIPLKRIWPCLSPKYFGKLSDIYQLNIIRPHLWKIWVSRSWGELRLHYPIFLAVGLPFPLKNIGKFHNFLISFVVDIISWKWEASSWWVEIYPEIGPICLVPGLISPNLGHLTEWISFLLQILTCLEG